MLLVPPCPSNRGKITPLAALPPIARPSFPPAAATASSPPCAAATLPSFARLPPVRAALSRRYADPRSASLRSGDGRPRFGHGPAAGAAWRGLRRGLAIPRPAVTPAASTAGLRVELARWRSLASASPKGLGVNIGGVLRGVLPRSSALRASGGGARVFIKFRIRGSHALHGGRATDKLHENDE